jgi:predicted Zn finger-like uncharacterized protein
MDLKVDLTCPNCKGKFKLKVSQLFPGTSVSCPFCKTVFQFTGDDGREIQEAFGDLEKTIKNFPKKLG